MRQALLTGSALYLLALHVQGQQVARFDTVRFNQAGRFAVGFSVFEVDSGYITFSIQKGSDLLSQNIYTTLYDTVGAVVDEREFATYQQDWFGTCSPVTKDTSCFYAAVGRFGVLGPMDSLLLYKFNAEGDTVDLHFLGVDTTFGCAAIRQTSRGDLLICGLHEPPREAFIYHIDTLANVYGLYTYPTFDGNDVAEASDGSWFLCGVGNVVANNYRGILVRSDTLGTELWRRTTSQYATYVHLITTHDGAMVAIGSLGDGIDGGYSLASKFDTTGTELWHKELLQSDENSRPSIFQAGYESEDSSLVVCGWVRRSDVLTKGTVVKLDKDGNVLWTRLYSHYVVQSISLEQILWDVKPTRDGGMVLTGEANNSTYPYGQLWLLKLDSAGCLVPGCGSVGVQEFVDDLNKHLRVWPNPASDVLQLSLALPEGAEVHGGVRAMLLDGTGRVVQEQPVRQNLNLLNATMDVSALHAGTYYLHLRDGKRWLAGSKVVVE